ncbi:MAG: DUF362 domain-containing protein [Acidobacteriota bacterium]|nr:DUF362 domain-containing protein [Acidobacteriota bacterium]
MKQELQNQISNARVSAVKCASASYAKSEIAAAIRRNAENLGWADDVRGAFGKMIAEGAKVVVKPNLVLHRNQGKEGLLPLVTHQLIIQIVVAEVLKANPQQVIVGDAPIQSCDLDALLRATKLDEWSENLKQADTRFKGIVDFRRTISKVVGGVREAKENQRDEKNYVLFNLGADSALEPLTDDRKSFRVTNYDPRLMAKTHSPGNHQYLVAREIIEADVVINLPKLKTHKKAGITNALKNLVGINGNKEFLPHHRLGGESDGGDCYPDKDLVKRSLEYIYDRQNMTTSPAKGKMLATVGTQFERMMRLRGDETGIEGAWSGNETVPRMCIDLNRVLLYGKSDAKFGETVQRRVLHVVDAVIAGQGDGPLASDALALGLILAGENAAAIDWVGAYLLGYDPRKIPLLIHSLEDFRWRIADFEPDEIELLGDWEKNQTAANLIELARNQQVTYPAGWRDAKAETADD